MNTPRPPDYYPANSPSRLSIYKSCLTPINGDLWLRHLRTIEVLESQAVRLGMPAVALELALLKARHVAAQLKTEMELENE
jgi:hypothetical protein